MVKAHKNVPKKSLQSPFWEFFSVFLNEKIQQNQRN
jgi:hypothetical protein